MMDNLEGVTAATFPKHPSAILGEMIQREHCELAFEYREEIKREPDVLQHTCGTRIQGGDRNRAVDGHVAFYGVAKIKGPGGRLVAVSEEKSAGTKRAVRAHCAEQVLLRWHEDPALFQAKVQEARA